jgi:hypothetical protein
LALRTIGNATIGVALGMSVLGMAFVLSQFAAVQGTVSFSRATSGATASSVIGLAATPTPQPSSPPPTAVATSSPTASPTSTPTATPTAPPTATPTPSPAASPDAMTVNAYTNGGKRYAALRAPVGYVYLAPVAGTVRVQQYQLIDGEVRVGSFVPTLPFFPYITISSADRRIIFRPGALNADTEMLIKDGDRADRGTPLFKTVGEGASSWRTFYDRGVTANVIASVAVLPSGAELDPVAFFTTR